MGLPKTLFKAVAPLVTPESGECPAYLVGGLEKNDRWRKRPRRAMVTYMTCSVASPCGTISHSAVNALEVMARPFGKHAGMWCQSTGEQGKTFLHYCISFKAMPQLRHLTLRPLFGDCTPSLSHSSSSRIIRISPKACSKRLLFLMVFDSKQCKHAILNLKS